MEEDMELVIEGSLGGFRDRSKGILGNKISTC
jgi:hypothetical protein